MRLLWFLIVLLIPMISLLLMTCFLGILVLSYRKILLRPVTPSIDEEDQRRHRRNHYRQRDLEINQESFYQIRRGQRISDNRSLQRFDTYKAMNKIMTEWRRGLSLSQQEDNTKIWVICLDNFRPEDYCVELKCGKGHCFHWNWINTWAQRNKSCPVCRKDFINIAKEEIRHSYQDPSLSWSHIQLDQ